MFSGLPLDFSQQLGYFLVFDGDDFFKAVEFDAKDFSLVLEIFLDVFEFKVDHFLKLLFNPADFLVFLLDGFGFLLLFVLDNPSQPGDLLVLFSPYLLHSPRNDSLNSLLLVNDLL